jgi:hypothetical protein
MSKTIMIIFLSLALVAEVVIRAAVLVVLVCSIVGLLVLMDADVDDVLTPATSELIGKVLDRTAN